MLQCLGLLLVGVSGEQSTDLGVAVRSSDGFVRVYMLVADQIIMSFDHYCFAIGHVLLFERTPKHGSSEFANVQQSLVAGWGFRHFP